MKDPLALLRVSLISTCTLKLNISTWVEGQSGAQTVSHILWMHQVYNEDFLGWKIQWVKQELTKISEIQYSHC